MIGECCYAGVYVFGGDSGSSEERGCLSDCSYYACEAVALAVDLERDGAECADVSAAANVLSF